MNRLLPYILASWAVVWDYDPLYCDTLEVSRDLKSWTPIARSFYVTNLTQIRVGISTNLANRYFRVNRNWPTNCP